MEVDLPEHLKCPVCLEIPENEIYQCKNGHIICNICVESLLSCPQCREVYGTSKMRNRAAESLLDLMRFDCSFKRHGCTEKVSRKEASTHLEDCEFGGESVTLCRNIGYNCDFVIKTRRLNQAVTHLKENHQVLFTADTALQMNLKGITEGDRKSKTLWNPIIITTDNIRFIILTFSNIKHVISFFCLCLGDIEKHKFRLEYTISGKSSEIPALEWGMTPIPATKSENILRANPFRFPLELFEGQYMNKDDLVIRLSLTKLSVSGSSANASWKPISPSKALNILLEKKLPSDSSGHLTMSRSKNIRGTKVRRAPLTPGFKNESSLFSSLLLSDDTEQAVHDEIQCATCDLCSSKIFVTHRYKCLICRDYDLCQNCIKTSQHPHVFAVIQNYYQDQAFLNKLGGRDNAIPYFDLGNQNPFGGEPSLHSNLGKIAIYTQKTATCYCCTKTTEFICLVCRGARSFCGSCFQKMANEHSISHYFAVVKNKKAREDIIKMLCQQDLF